MHSGRTRRHAGQAREATIDVFDDGRRCRLVPLEHVFDLVDAAARAVEFVAEQEIGWASCRAEPAMHAGSQDLLRRLDRGIVELFCREGCLHGSESGVHPARIEYPRRIERRFQPSLEPRDYRARRIENVGCSTNFVGCPHERSVSARVPDGVAHDRRAGIARFRAGEP